LQKKPEITSETRKTFGQIITLGLVFLFPAILFSLYLRSFIAEQERLSLDQELDQCRLIMARLQSETNLKSVIEKGLQKFLIESESLLSEAHESSEPLSRLENLFYQRFSKRVKILWLDNSQKILNLQQRMKNKTAWQRFARCLIAPDKADKLDYKIADNFVKTYTSEFLDHSFFAATLYEPVKTLFQGKPFFLRTIRIPGNKFSLRHAIIKLPLSNAKRDWIEIRALKRINSRKYKAGIYRISDQFTYPGSQISENLMHGHSEEFRAGKSWKLSNQKLFVYGHQLDNPDNFFCVSKDLQKSNFSSHLLNSLNLLAFVPFLLALLMRLLSNINLTERLSISSKFRIATISLTVFPILLLITASFIYGAQLNLELEKNIENTLDYAIDELNDRVPAQTLELENFLKNELPGRLADKKYNKQTAKEAFKLLRPSGCHLAIIITKNGKVFYDTSLVKDVAEPRVSVFAGLIKLPLINAGFDYEKIEKQSSIKFDDKLSDYHKKKFRYDFYNRLNVIEMGPATACLFATFIRNRNNEIVACAALGFDHHLMQQSFLQKSLKNIKQLNPRLFFRPRSNTGTFYRPASGIVAEQLDLTALTGDSFTRKFNYNSTEYMSFSRLLKDVPTAVVAVTKVAGTSSSLQFVFIAIISLLSLLAIINSASILQLLQKIFLKPVLKLGEVVKEIGEGNFKAKLPVDSHDEIGQLNSSLNLMTRELETKATMRDYLSEALYTNQASDQQVKIEKIQATIMFCGIRNFAALEKALEVQKAFNLMNLFLSRCDSTIKECNGQTDKFMGETIMAYFPTNSSTEAEKNALKASIRIKNNLSKELQKMSENERFSFGIGIASGKVIAGHIGSMHKRLDYTVIGDAVNLAARLEKMAGRKSASGILTTEEVLTHAGKEFSHISKGKIKVKGKAEPVEVFEVSE
jgi:class 3 adenylate cyclase